MRAGIAHAVAAADVQHLRHVSQTLMQLSHEGGHDVNGVLEDGLVKDFGADVAVQAADLQRGKGQRLFYKGVRLTGLDGNAELDVHGAGADGLVGVRVDAGGDAEQDLLRDALPPRFGSEGLKLIGVVHNEVSDAVFHTVADVGVGLAVAVEEDPVRGKADAEGGVYFARGDGVNAHAFLRGNAVDLLEGGGLPGVERERPVPEAGPEGFGIEAAVVTDTALIHQIEGRAVLFRERGDAVAGKEQAAVRRAGYVVSQHGKDPPERVYRARGARFFHILYYCAEMSRKRTGCRRAACTCCRGAYFFARSGMTKINSRELRRSRKG